MLPHSVSFVPVYIYATVTTCGEYISFKFTKVDGFGEKDNTYDFKFWIKRSH